MNTPRNELVVKSNALINAMIDLNLQEKRLLAFAISRLDRSVKYEPGRPVDVEIDVPAFAGVFELDPKSAYREIKALANKLLRKIIDFEAGGHEIGVGLLSKRKYHTGEGRLWLRFDEDLVPHLLGLQERFTQYRLKDVYQFASTHSWRVYELLLQYKEIGKRDFDLDEFKRKVGVAGLYSRMDHLRARVIDTAIREINATSDIQVEWEQIKRGRRIVGLRFHIAPNQATKTPREKIREKAERALGARPCLAPDLAKLLREEYRVNAKQAKALADLAAGDREAEARSMLPKLRKRWEKLPEAKRVALGGYVFKALKAHLTQGTLI